MGESPWGFKSLQPHFSTSSPMHPPALVAHAVRLGSKGLNAVEIARELDVPRRTVADWLAGKIPRRSEGVVANGPPPRACERCGGAHDLGGLTSAYVYLLGLYLGDGCISSHPRGVYNLRIVLDAKYPDIIGEAERSIRKVAPWNTVTARSRPDNCVEVSAYWKSWPCFFPQHGLGKKHQRRIVLVQWQRELTARWPEALLRGLIHSDGCRFMNTGRRWRHPRYSFCNLSEDIKGIFCDACDQLDLHWTRAGPKTIYVSRRADVAALDRIVGPKY